MLSVFQRFLDWIKSLFWKEEMELTLVGLQNSGKSTFVHVIATGAFSEEMMPTVGFAMRKITKGAVTIKMWDIGGQPRFRSMWERYCRGVNAIVFMVDAADFEKVDTARSELHSLLERPQLAAIPLLVLGNKRDLPNALDERGLIAKLGLTSVTDREVCCYSISCKNKENLDITLNWLIAHAGSKRHAPVNTIAASASASQLHSSAMVAPGDGPRLEPVSSASSAHRTSVTQPQPAHTHSNETPASEKTGAPPAAPPQSAPRPPSFASEQPPSFAESVQVDSEWPVQRAVEPVADEVADATGDSS